jgi:hypothetical protein
MSRLVPVLLSLKAFAQACSRTRVFRVYAVWLLTDFRVFSESLAVTLGYSSLPPRAPMI